jgi:hypothetical protein
MTGALEQANLYELVTIGDETQVYYSTTPLGPPEFTYVFQGSRTLFSGNQIETRATALGEEVTVTLESVADDHTTTLTVLIPATTVALGDKVPLRTLGVLTTTTTAIAGSPSGVSQTYLALDLHGMAKQVVF